MNEGSNRPTSGGPGGEQSAALDESARAKILRLVPAHEQKQVFLDMLEEWVEAARAGRLTSLVIAGVVDGEVETQYGGSYLEAIAGLELAKAHIMDGTAEEDD